jgi:hypothetical protein
MPSSTDSVILYLKYSSVLVFSFCCWSAFSFWFEGPSYKTYLPPFGQPLKPPEKFLHCASRINGRGFTRNPDFYGLGIRIGVYLQWITSLTANILLPRERGYVAATYVLFSMSALVALPLLVFGEASAFTAEIIVILNILWGGTWLVDLTVSRRLGTNEMTSSARLFGTPISAKHFLLDRKSRPQSGLCFALSSI